MPERGYAARYIGSLVGDFHRNLLKGGIYLYPPTAKAPGGKLRLLYECYPLAFLIEQAGGQATDGENRILALPLRKLHQRTPLCIGSAAMVSEVAFRMNGQADGKKGDQRNWRRAGCWRGRTGKGRKDKTFRVSETRKVFLRRGS